jgi:hypothetical protein
MIRATMSLGPPAGNGTIIRIGRLGKLAARSWLRARVEELIDKKHPIEAAASKQDRQEPRPM